MSATITDRMGVTGHQQLPREAQAFLTRWLGERIRQPEQVEVVCSLAVGADSMVAEYLTERGARLHAIIPCSGYESTFEAASDLIRYQLLLARAAVVEELEFEKPSEEAFMAAGELVVRSSDWLLAIWDGQASRGLGGTGDAVALARSLGKRVRVVWPRGVKR